MSLLGRIALSQTVRKCVSLSRANGLRCISTSKKNSDTTTIETAVGAKEKCEPQSKNWISYGFSQTDEVDDRNQMNALFFFGVTIAIVFTGFTLAYRPDELMRDWSQREAFLELRRREAAGLPLIDANYIPLDKINLPTDEELGDTDIII